MERGDLESEQIRSPWALAKEGAAASFARADNPWRAVGVVPVQAILPLPMLPPVIAPPADDRANDGAARELQHLFTHLLETFVTRERDAFCREFHALAHAATALDHLSDSVEYQSTLKDAIGQADLTGFALEHLWSSDTGGIRRPWIGMEGLGGEAGRLRQARNDQARRDMLDRMRREGLTPALAPITHR